ncbi:aspartate-ammonia ligase [Chitinophaga terrae (ex Kim and Jung 2007)]|uniref:Aspartate--ammonia ligase n=1 Tax=Chitinophaga terrae (ex Kim and Jung 2007) TaxID=408074 RepID=A0A1H4AWL4_9BACT|nr:aspartate--ammonia ligase [Chitinophaga terrae (ex Kim and Jung 2007)]SEA40279.1 aspartate-ammonia ligase [Chitinophaga terrae (ex Kim and Jung 2007)]
MSSVLQAASQSSLLAREKAIAFIKDYFSTQLCKQLSLTKVAAPLFVKSGTGLNDDLNGVERPVVFQLKGVNGGVEIVQSLAKWKRKRLHELEIPAGHGIVTDMRAIRPDEVISPIHSFFVDQWDWEKRIAVTDRNIAYLKETVLAIYAALVATNNRLKEEGEAGLELPETVHFIHSETLLQQYPNLTPKERENACAKKYGAIFIIGIGAPLSNSQVHDDRAPDYDDWTTANEDGHTGLNGDLIIWNPALNAALEISSMGIRVDAAALRKQLKAKNCEQRAEMEFHSNVLSSTYPLSMGGGIGQSRLCMLLLQQKHIADVQASVWPEGVR